MKKFYFTHFLKKGRTLPYLTLLNLIFVFGTVNAQVAFQNNGTGISVSSSATATISDFNVPAGTNRLLVVFISSNNTISGITYNGQNLSSAIESNNGVQRSAIWYATISGTSSITSDIVVTFSGTVIFGNVGAGSFTGVDSSTPIGNTNSDNSSCSTSKSLLVSTSNNNGVVDAIRYAAGGTITFGANQAEIYQNNNSNIQGGASFELATGSSVSMSFTVSPGSSSTFCPYCAAELNHAATAPIELKYFRAHPNPQSVTLNWATATEVNNDYFTIERSVNGTDFESIGEVKGTGTSYEELTYSFEDTRLPQGQNQLYYRLHQTDFDGTSSIEKVISVRIHDFQNLSNFKITPNPIQNNQFTLYIPEIEMEQATLEIFNTVGQLVQTEVLTDSEMVIRTDNLPTGMYWFSVNLNGKKEVRKVVIE